MKIFNISQFLINYSQNRSESQQSSNFSHLLQIIRYEDMANIRKQWTPQSVTQLINIVQSADQPINWANVATHLNAQVPHAGRNGKQCRERWNLEMSRKEESDAVLRIVDFQKFFNIYKKNKAMKNQWKLMAAELKNQQIDCNHNKVKNYFYCCVRKALRKINNKCLTNKFDAQKIRSLKPLTLSKLCSELDQSMEYLEIIENLLTHGVPSLNDISTYKSMLEKAFEINDDYIAEKDIVPVSPKHRKLSDSTNIGSEINWSSESREQNDKAEQVYMVDPFEIPGLKKGHSEMFFPEICEIIEKQQSLHDIGIYFNF